MITSLELAKDLNCLTHKGLLKTIDRFVSHGISEDEIKEGTFKNKMNREYKMYYLSERVVNMLEAIYLFSGKGASELIQEKSLPKEELVYFISDGDKVKIGCTSDLKTRISALQVGNYKFIEVLMAINNVGKSVEKELHNIFKDHHISGEWYNLDVATLRYISLNYTNISIHLSLDGLIFELWHLAKDGTKELSISDFTNSSNYRVKRQLKNIIQKGLDENSPYEQIIADSLNFTKSINR